MYFFFFFNDTATTEIYTLSLHDALPILLLCLYPTQEHHLGLLHALAQLGRASRRDLNAPGPCAKRSEEHTSELQSHLNLVCRLLLEKKKKNIEDLIKI